MILMKKLRKSTVNNAENNLLVQKFQKKTWKKLINTEKGIKTIDYENNHVFKEKNARKEKTSFLCPELLECQVCEEHYESKVGIENCVLHYECS